MSTESSIIVRGAQAARAVPIDLADGPPVSLVGAVGPWAEKLEESRQAAANDGYMAGHAQGYEAGILQSAQDAQENARLLATSFERLMAELQLAVDDVARRVAAQSGAMAVELASLVLDRELELSDDPGMEAIARCAAVAPACEELKARVHPDTVALIGRTLDLAGVRVQVVADPTLQRGDAIVQADDSIVDGRIATALARVAEVLS